MTHPDTARTRKARRKNMRKTGGCLYCLTQECDYNRRYYALKANRAKPKDKK